MISARALHWVVAGLMLAAAGLAVALTPKTQSSDTRLVNLAEAVPERFGDWQVVPSAVNLTDVTPDNENEAKFYDQRLLRTYRGPNGALVMLALAWGSRQNQEVKVHRPELCYRSQGFQILSVQRGTLSLGVGEVPVTRILARNRLREEPITYWIRLGDSFSGGPFDTRLHIIKEGLLGNVPDGILVRVSTISQGETAQEFRLQQTFLNDLVTHLDGAGKRLMLGKVSARASSRVAQSMRKEG